MLGLLDLRARGQSDVTSAERRGVFGDLRLSRFLQSGEEESQCGWYVVSSFVPPLSLSLRVGVSSLRVSSAFFCSGPAVEKFVFYSVFFCSDRINWIFFVFYRKGHGLSDKLLLIFSFFDKFHRHFAMRGSYMQKPLFFLLKKVSALITSGDCSCGH